MSHASWDLGPQSEGTVVRVVLEGNAANVRLLDNSNYRAYAAGQSHRCVGGFYKSSPVILRVPHVGHWWVAVDYGGGAGHGRAAVQVLKAA